MANVCIICQAEKDGEPVADTVVIKAIRSLKERLRVASGNTLVVCPECRPVHAERLKSFEGHLVTHLIIIALIVVVLLVLPLLTGGFSLGSLFVTFVLAVFLSLLGLIGYVPPLEKGASALPGGVSAPPEGSSDANPPSAPAETAPGAVESAPEPESIPETSAPAPAPHAGYASSARSRPAPVRGSHPAAPHRRNASGPSASRPPKPAKPQSRRR